MYELLYVHHGQLRNKLDSEKNAHFFLIEKSYFIFLLHNFGVQYILSELKNQEKNVRKENKL